MRYTIILVPSDEGVSVSVPAMPGCVTYGRNRSEAVSRVQESIAGWIATEATQGRVPREESPALVSQSVSEALEILQEMREAGEMSAVSGYELELTTVEVPQPVAA